MSADAKHEQPADGVYQYTALCLVSLVATALPLLARGLGVWALFPAMVGALAVAGGWRVGPVLFLVCLLWLAVSDNLGGNPLAMLSYLVGYLDAVREGHAPPPSPGLSRHPLRADSPLLDLLLTVAVVFYVAAHYRLISLTQSVFPIDKRRRARRKADRGEGEKPALGPVIAQPRSPGVVDPREATGVLLAALFCGAVAQLFWLWLSERQALADLNELAHLGTRSVQMSNGTWRLLVLIWVVGLLMLVLTGWLGYLGQQRLSAAEAALYLQDQLWQQTRREQARLNRWLAWAVLRRKRREARRAARNLPKERT